MELLLVAAIGGALALDATSAGQFMVSRPLVAGALTGWVLGDPAQGLLIGAVLELYLLVSFPSGGSRFPEGPTATVVAVATAGAMAGPGSVPTGVAMGLVLGHVGGMSISLLRRLNGRFVPDAPGASPRRLVASHLLALGLDFARGAAITLAGVLVGRLAAPHAVAAWPLGEGDSAGLLLVGGAVSAGIMLRSLGGFRRRRLLFTAGLALGLIGIRLLS